MKRIIFVTSIKDWQQIVTSSLANWEDYIECVTYEETQEAIDNNETDILTTSMAHFTLQLIDDDYNIYLYKEGKLKKITVGKKLNDNNKITNNDNLLQLYQNDLL